MKKSKDELLDDDYNVNIFRYASKKCLAIIAFILFFYLSKHVTCNIISKPPILNSRNRSKPSLFYLRIFLHCAHAHIFEFE